MGRKCMTKVPINSKRLKTLISCRTTFTKLGPEIGYSERTIRLGIAEGKMSYDMVMKIAWKLGYEPELFADLDTYYNSTNDD